MVDVNVPELHARKLRVRNLHAIVGILAATVTIPTGCSGEDFEGCEASRTCPPKGGEAGEGTGGESGGGNDTGGRSTGGNSTGGNSGSANGGSATGGSDDGEAGSGATGGSGDDDTEAPTIVSITPGDGDVDVERDVTVTIEFSEPIDEDSVTETSVVLTGPDGDVSGTLGVDDNVVTFTAEKKLYLLGDYELAIDETIADLAGNTLGDAESVGFRVRDGRWSEPVYPFGETVPRVLTQFQRNEHGDVVVGMEIWPGRENLYSAIYRAADDAWTPAKELSAPSGAVYSTYSVGIDPAGRAVVSWAAGDGTTFGWSRNTNGNDWVDSGALSGYASVFAASNGLATASWWEAFGVGTRTQNLADGALESPNALTLQGNSYGPYPIASLDRMAILAETRSSSTGDELWISWKTGSRWTEPELLASAPLMGRFAFDSDELGNMIVLWSEGEQIWSRIYDRASDSWSRELFVAATSPDSLVGFVDMTGGSALACFNTFAPDPSTWSAVYQAGVGWVEPSVIRVDEVNTGVSVGIAYDRGGNGMSVWRPDGDGDFQFRRYLAQSGWQQRGSLPLDINPYYLWAAAAPDGSVTVVGNALEDGMNHAPLAIRFE